MKRRTGMTIDCLVLDHDDTAVNSTATIHYPAHLKMMGILRPEEPVIDLETWFLKNFDPGIMTFLAEELGLSDEELAEEFRIWQDFNEERVPPFYPGLPELLGRFSEAGGVLAVVSHSTERHIRRHYAEGCPDAQPDFVFGWEHEASKRKPSPWPLEKIIEQTGIDPSRMLVVDDLKPGVDMARAAGVPVAAAGWGHDVPQIREAMKRLCDFWLPDIPALKSHIFP